MAIGIVAIAEMIIQFEEKLAEKATDSPAHGEVSKFAAGRDSSVTREDWRNISVPIIRGTAIGSAIGLLPGLGAAIGSFASYGATRKFSKNPESFGKGNVQGVAAAESAENAVMPASLITPFALGIPGSVIAAILAAGFTMHEIIPGPLMLRDNPEFMLGLYGSLLLASLIMLLIGWFGMRFFV